MILADTSIWIDYLRDKNKKMEELLGAGQIIMHPFVLAEISLGSLRNRRKTLATMENLLQTKVAQLSEVRQMVEAHTLYSKGIGLIDAHLVASCLLSPGTRLWTRDARLDAVARSLNIAF
jgi:predicted nucleic acid-binding protein